MGKKKKNWLLLPCLALPCLAYEERSGRRVVMFYLMFERRKCSTGRGRGRFAASFTSLKKA